MTIKEACGWLFVRSSQQARNPGAPTHHEPGRPECSPAEQPRQHPTSHADEHHESDAEAAAADGTGAADASQAPAGLDAAAELGTARARGTGAGCCSATTECHATEHHAAATAECHAAATTECHTAADCHAAAAAKCHAATECHAAATAKCHAATTAECHAATECHAAATAVKQPPAAERDAASTTAARWVQMCEVLFSNFPILYVIVTPCWDTVIVTSGWDSAPSTFSLRGLYSREAVVCFYFHGPLLSSHRRVWISAESYIFVLYLSQGLFVVLLLRGGGGILLTCECSRITNYKWAVNKAEEESDLVGAALLQTPPQPGGMRPMLPTPGQPQLHPEGNGQPGTMAGPSQFGPGGPGQFGPGSQPCPPIHGSQPPPVVQSIKGESTDAARWELVEFRSHVFARMPGEIL